MKEFVKPAGQDVEHRANPHSQAEPRLRPSRRFLEERRVLGAVTIRDGTAAGGPEAAWQTRR